MELFEKLLKKEESVALIGLGYVGLPIALAFAKKIKVVGFDINPSRVELMKKGIDPSKELDQSEFEGCDIHFTCDQNELRKAKIFIVAVPTPIDDSKIPDLTPLMSASKTVGQVLKKGDYVVFESTVYPGCTEEDCVPILEKESGLKYLQDFKVGYSPERINPGDKKHTLENVVKVVSGCDDESLEIIAKLYELVVLAGVHRANSIKVAEAAKIIENTQRDVNIALMNELSIIFDKMKINTYDVLEAAGTKWNFLSFYPGLVGGHCIGVDPYYLTYKAAQLGYHSKVINSGRSINDGMPTHIANNIVKKIIKTGTNIQDARILVLGTTFKENVTDIRNSKVADMVHELLSFHIHIDVIDPMANSDEVFTNYGYKTVPQPSGLYDVIIIAVSHDKFISLNEEYFQSLIKPGGMIADLKGIYRDRINNINYCTL
jgi:UDP-N-acetyl-D-galactosamine dehydrogenase